MRSPDFQIALARLIASPQLCGQTLLDEDILFREFLLTEKEKLRLHAILRQKGMSVCCSLYRMNRITPVYTQLANTSLLLGDDFVPLVEKFWLQQPDSTLQFKDEVLAFGHFLLSMIENGLLKHAYLKEILQLEIAINELSYDNEGKYRILKFDHDIFKILELLNNGRLQEETVEAADAVYKLYMRNQKLKMELD